jgi:TetR/AcrR family transcriptional regulator
MSSHDELRQIALAEFARAGYGATSLQRIAEIAGLSKSSVLYHFASKEALLEAAIAPALAGMEQIIDRLEATPTFTDETRAEFVEAFTDLILTFRLEVNMFINQGPSLEDVPVVDRANRLVYRLATYFNDSTLSLQDRMRFRIALGGAAYMLCAPSIPMQEPEPIDEIRAALIPIITELLSPVSVRSTPTA